MIGITAYYLSTYVKKNSFVLFLHERKEDVTVLMKTVLNKKVGLFGTFLHIR